MIQTMKKCGVLALAVAWLTPLPQRAAVAMEHTPALDAVAAAAAKEGTLNVLWSGALMGGAKGAAAFQDALNREFNLRIKIVFTPGPATNPLATRIIQEVTSGQPASSDVFLGASIVFPAMMEARVLDEVLWSSLNPSIKPDMQTKNGEAVLAYTLFNTFTYNARLVPKDKVPHDFAGIFRPEWKGKLASTPYVQGFDQLALQVGDAKIRPIVQKMAQWTGGLIRCGSSDRIASGEFIGFALDCGQVDEQYTVANGGPVGTVLLDDGLSTALIYLGVPKTSAHPNMAKLFSSYVVSAEGQAILAKYNVDTSHLFPGTSAYERAQSLAARGLKLVTWSPDEIAPQLEKADALRKDYEEILRGK